MERHFLRMLVHIETFMSITDSGARTMTIIPKAIVRTLRVSVGWHGMTFCCVWSIPVETHRVPMSLFYFARSDWTGSLGWIANAPLLPSWTRRPERCLRDGPQGDSCYDGGSDFWLQNKPEWMTGLVDAKLVGVGFLFCRTFQSLWHYSSGSAFIFTPPNGFWVRKI